MTEENSIPLILAAAASTAGAMGNNPGAWLGKVNAAIPPIAAMMNDQSRQWTTALEVLEAAVFTGTYKGYALEESSTRLVVSLVDNKGEIEEIRTHRTDQAAGKRMKAMLDRLDVGDELIVWKALEKMGDDRKVRVLVHFQTRGRRPITPSTDAPSEPTPNGSDVEHEPPPEGSEGLPSDGGSPPDMGEWVAKTLKHLGPYRFNVLVREMNEVGIDLADPASLNPADWGVKVKPAITRIHTTVPEDEEPF